MGTWNVKIKGNDTTLDIYSCFFDRYNSGEEPENISESIIEEFHPYFEDYDDKNNAYFGLALAQWETKTLAGEIFNTVKNIITSGSDLKLWAELGADEKTINRRKIELEKFLVQISTKKAKPKRRVRPKFDFELVEIARNISPDQEKEFSINEEYVNKSYTHTSGLMKWYSGGGAGILYFNKSNKNISIEWLDSQTLLVTHDKEIEFTKKETKSFFRGDLINIEYLPKEYT